MKEHATTNSIMTPSLGIHEGHSETQLSPRVLASGIAQPWPTRNDTAQQGDCPSKYNRNEWVLSTELTRALIKVTV